MTPTNDNKLSADWLEKTSFMPRFTADLHAGRYVGYQDGRSALCGELAMVFEI